MLTITTELLKSTLPALIALAGTLVVVFAGFRQWKQHEKASRAHAVWEKKAAAYAGFWELIESTHVELRGDKRKASANLADCLRRVNEYAMKNGLYIAAEDRELANKYLFLVSEMASDVARSGDVKAADELYRTVPVSDMDFQSQQAAIDRVKADLHRRCRQIVVAT